MVKKFFLGSFSLGLNIVIYIIIILAALRIVTFSYNFSYEVFGNTAVAAPSEEEEVITVQIPDGASTDEIASLLKDKGLIRYKEAFVLHVAISQYKGLIKPGTYELKKSMTMDEILEIICQMSEMTPAQPAG